MEFYRASPWRWIATLFVVIVLALATVSHTAAQSDISPDEVCSRN